MTVEALAMMSMGVSVEEIPAKARHSQGTAAEKSWWRAKPKREHHVK